MAPPDSDPGSDSLTTAFGQAQTNMQDLVEPFLQSEAVHSSGTWMEEKRAHVSFTATSCVHLIYPETKTPMAEAQDLLSQTGFSAPNEILGCLLQHTLTVVSRTLEGYLKDACKP